MKEDQGSGSNKAGNQRPHTCRPHRKGTGIDCKAHRLLDRLEDKRPDHHCNGDHRQYQRETQGRTFKKANKLRHRQSAF